MPRPSAPSWRGRTAQNYTAPPLRWQSAARDTLQTRSWISCRNQPTACPAPNRSPPSRSCSGRAHNCWPRPLSLKSAARGGTAADMFPSELRQSPSAPDPPSLSVARAFPPRPNFVNHRRLQIHHHCPWHVLSRPRFAEKRVERIISSSYALVRWHLPIRLDAVLQTEQLPARVANLHSRLADVDRDALPHDECGEIERELNVMYDVLPGYHLLWEWVKVNK